jgi:hypothetical protein
LIKQDKKIFSIEELNRKLDSLEFDMKGHLYKKDAIISELRRKIDFSLEMAEKYKDDESMLRMFKADVVIGEPLMIGGQMTTFKCHHMCGSSFYLSLVDENSISILRIEGGYPTSDPMKFFHDEKCDCEYKDGVPLAVTRLHFEDELVFANAFRNSTMDEWLFSDAPEDMEYDDEFDLCTVKGRKAISKFRAEEHNLAFGGMSNMSIAIYASKDRDHFIMTRPGLDERNGKKEGKTLKFLEDGGFENIGRIGLGVWRWEATDRKTLDAVGYDETKHARDYDDLVISKIPSGEWEVIHHFDSYKFGYDFVEPNKKSKLEIYSELKLIKQ